MLVLDDFVGKQWILSNSSKRPVIIPPTGISDIKWIELFKKWGPLIPQEKKAEFKYYNEDPGERRRKRVASQSKTSKKQRKDRSHTEFQEPKADAGDGTKAII